MESWTFSNACRKIDRYEQSNETEVETEDWKYNVKIIYSQNTYLTKRKLYAIQ